MLRVLQSDLYDTDHFVVTLELVPGRESGARGVDQVMGIARDAFSDGRISAVSMTDNPGGNPALSPDVLGHEIFKIGMDVIVHFTCRDMNRVGMESRALQLAMMGMKNILALSGDYSGQGFGGQGAPVFDLDSVQLQILFSMLNERLSAGGDPDPFFPGCAVSPFKTNEAETFAQYAKLCRKSAAGAQFIITQLGYDMDKFRELMRMMEVMGLKHPVLGSIYVLTPKAARIMNRGKVPGALVSNALLQRVEKEWQRGASGKAAAVERAAKTAAVLKGMGYRGIHIGGIHRDFETVGRILDRLKDYENCWREWLSEVHFPQHGSYYVFAGDKKSPQFARHGRTLGFKEKMHFSLLNRFHDVFFNSDHRLAPFLRKAGARMEGNVGAKLLMDLFEDPVKGLLLNCRRCGDCAIQHLGFLCPESGCPKHMRNGACGGSTHGKCEVYPENPCIWVRAYDRLAHYGRTGEMIQGCVPPRMWELNQSSSWLNFHLKRDHQSSSCAIARRCRLHTCKIP